MVGYDPKSSIQLTTAEKTLVSVGTSVFSRFLIQPFDVIKIRFQVQYEPISTKTSESKYKGIRHACRTIRSEEGLRAFWKGHLTGQLLYASYITAQFHWFDFFTRTSYQLWPQHRNKNEDNHKHLFDFVCGGLAATFTTLTSQPIDTIRTRFVTQGEPKVYSSLSQAVQKIYSQEGLLAFYKGTVPAILLVVPESAFRFSIYSWLNVQWSRFRSSAPSGKNTENNEIGMLQSSVNGAISGVCAKTVIYPFDLVKKRLQIQGFERARSQFGKIVKFDGMWHCFRLTFASEGLSGIYKGYLASMIKAGVSTGCIFFFYEGFSNFARFLKKKKKNSIEPS